MKYNCTLPVDCISLRPFFTQSNTFIYSTSEVSENADYDTKSDVNGMGIIFNEIISIDIPEYEFVITK
jgi:hypothetical protein